MDKKMEHEMGHIRNIGVALVISPGRTVFAKLLIHSGNYTWLFGFLGKLLTGILNLREPRGCTDTLIQPQYNPIIIPIEP